MKISKGASKAISFLIDNFIILLVSDLLATFLNPYADNSKNLGNLFLIYLAITFIYFGYTIKKYKKTIGERIAKLK